MQTLYFAKLRPDAILPAKREEDAGYDIYICLDEDFLCLAPHETRALPAGIASACAPDYYFQIFKCLRYYTVETILQMGGYVVNRDDY